jgi:hypothetical protein
MSYLLGAYAFGIVVLIGYAIYLVRENRAAAATLREAEISPPLGGGVRPQAGRG